MKKEKEYVRTDIKKCRCKAVPSKIFRGGFKKQSVRTIHIPAAYGFSYGCVDICCKCGKAVRERYYD